MRILNLITICFALNTFGQTYTYDLAGRMTCAIYTNGAQANFGYDHAGNVSSVSSAVLPPALPPVLAIQSIFSNSISGGAVFTLTGTASSANQVDWVFVEGSTGLNQLASTTNRWTNWSATIGLPYGTNYVTVLCQDVVGNLGSIGKTFVVTPPPFVAAPISFGQNGANWTMEQSGTFTTAEFTNGLLTLTDNGQSETRSFFYNTPQYIGAFYSSFTYQATGNKAGDGVAFVIQGDPRGQTAIGGAAGGLGVSGISPSVEVELNISTGGSQNVGYAVMTNGLTCSGGANGNYVGTGSINLNGGDPISIFVNYFGNDRLSLSFFDASTFLVFTTNVYIGNISSILGTDLAYIGFTGTGGGLTAVQTITNFSFISVPPPALAMQPMTVHFSGIVGDVQGNGAGYIGMRVSGFLIIDPSELQLSFLYNPMHYAEYQSTNVIHLWTNGVFATTIGYTLEAMHSYPDQSHNLVNYVSVWWGTNGGNGIGISFPVSSGADFSLYSAIEEVRLGLSGAFPLAADSSFWAGYDTTGTNGIEGDLNAFFVSTPELDVEPTFNKQIAVSWPTNNSMGFVLQGSPTLGQNATWFSLTNVPTVNSTSYEVQFPLPSASLATNQFFRLNFTN